MIKEKCKNCAEKKLIDEMEEMFKKYEKKEDNLIKILEEVQVKYGYIPKICAYKISTFLDIPLAQIYGVITFYSRFTLKPKGKYNISVCLGTACFVKGSKDILEAAKNRLGINEGETTKDGIFSIDNTRCIGACGLSPVFTVNDEVYGKATVKKLNEVLDNLCEENNL